MTPADLILVAMSGTLVAAEILYYFKPHWLPFRVPGPSWAASWLFFIPVAAISWTYPSGGPAEGILRILVWCSIGASLASWGWGRYGR